jgi:hypothetical protein
MSLAAIRARLEAATPGPWKWVADSGAIGLSTGTTLANGEGVLTVQVCESCFAKGDPCVGGSLANQALIAAARRDVEWLLGIAEAAQELVAGVEFLDAHNTSSGLSAVHKSSYDALREALARLDSEGSPL